MDRQGCDSKLSLCLNASEALRLKIGALAAILIASVLGVATPLLIKGFTKGKLFFAGRCFAAGIILATGFVHILPDSFDDLTNPCLPDMPWGKFPFAGFVAMLSAIVTLSLDTMGMSYYTRIAGRNADADLSKEAATEANNVEITVVSHSHGNPAVVVAGQQARNKVIAQVLELGIVTHSVVIGIGMGALKSPCAIRPLIAALCFHQFFEGMALGGCICLGQFTRKSSALMALLFSVTTPLGVAIGIGVASGYNENDPNALIIQGMFNAASSGILLYMALVDLIATDFLSKEFFENIPRQLIGYSALLLGATTMSILGIWA